MVEGVVWRGVEEFGRGITRIITAADVAGQEAVKTSAALMVREARLYSTGPARTSSGGGGEGTRDKNGRLRDSGGRFLAGGGGRGGGPGVVTGAHRRGIQVIDQGRTGPTGYQATIAPTLIYSRRLELGFEGTDSLGRRYHQPPYPYFRPAYDRVMQDGPDIFFSAWRKALGVA